MLEDILSYFGMSHNPFPVALDPKNYYQTESTKIFLEELLHGIESRKGFLVLVGEVGVGKTSLSLQLLKLLEEKKVPTSWVFNTVFTKEELLFSVARDWGMEPPDDIPFPRLVEAIHHYLLDQNKAGHNCVIIVDEAHNLDATSLEALRMLSNLEFDGRKLVQILLIGQQELHLFLEEPRMRQLLSRVAIFLEHPTLTKPEVKSYVDFKLAKADSQLRLDGRALDRLWESSQGNLRQMNLIMERALYACIALRESSLSSRVLDLAVRDVASCNRLVRKRVQEGRIKRLALWYGLPAILTLILALAFFLSRGGSKAPAAAETAPAEAAPAAAPATPAPGTAQPAALAPEKNGKKPETDPKRQEAEALLSPLGLESLAETLAAALREKSLARFTSALPQGLVWMEMARGPVENAPDRLVLPWGTLTGGQGVLVLMRVPGAFDRVIPGYAGPEAVYVQRLLKGVRKFEDKPDGVYGKKSWYALAEFQKENGLKASGLPDQETLARLSAQAAPSREERP